MYDMGAVNRNGYNKSQTARAAQGHARRRPRSSVIAEFTTGEQIFQGLPADAAAGGRRPCRLAMYHDFYRTARGIHVPEGRTPELTQNRTLAGEIKFMNFYPFNDIETISPRPMLFIAGDQAHSREFSEDAYARAAEPKELFWVRGRKPRRSLRPRGPDPMG